MLGLPLSFSKLYTIPPIQHQYHTYAEADESAAPSRIVSK